VRRGSLSRDGGRGKRYLLAVSLYYRVPTFRRKICFNACFSDSLELESELFNPFRGYESESDSFPLGKVRELWSEDGLKEMDRQRERTEAHYHDWIMGAAEKLLTYAREQVEKMAVPYKVRVMVDRQFGERLAALEVGVPVWIVDTSVNKPVAQRLWKERDNNDHLTGITTFNDAAAFSAEDILIERLEDIGLHHGWYSSDSPYTIIEVIGTSVSERVKTELGKYGFKEFRPSAEGFVAVRPLPPKPVDRNRLTDGTFTKEFVIRCSFVYVKCGERPVCHNNPYNNPSGKCYRRSCRVCGGRTEAKAYPRITAASLL
jgi:hypothetical protein